MTPRKTRLGRLSDLARHVVLPSGIVSTGWPAVRDQCSQFGDSFDEWQDGAGRAILAKRADGLYAATVGGVTLSIPRQVAKTFLVGRIVFALCVLSPGLTVIWTAHRTRTTTNSFRALMGYARRKKVAPHVKDIRRANGEQEISFKNGSIILFGAREQGFGRGFDEVDVAVFDEAQILTEKALEDIVPATNQSRHPHGALLFFMGTPPRPTDPGEAFTIRREKALAGKSDDGLYIEFSADEKADPDDRKQWAKANPSYPTHTPETAVLRMRENLADDDSFMREALGIWQAKSVSIIDFSRWGDPCEDDESQFDGSPVFAVDVTPDGMRASISAAGVRSDGLPHVETIDNRADTDWVVARLAELKAKWNPDKIVAGASSPAASVILDAAQAGLEIEQVSVPAQAQACGLLKNLVSEGRMRHRPEPLLDVALAGAAKRDVGDGAWLWSRKNSHVDISPLVAATLALAAVGAPAAPAGFTNLDDYLEE